MWVGPARTNYIRRWGCWGFFVSIKGHPVCVGMEWVNEIWEAANGFQREFSAKSHH